jgi:hypothetical protein
VASVNFKAAVPVIQSIIQNAVSLLEIGAMQINFPELFCDDTSVHMISREFCSSRTTVWWILKATE